MGDYLSDESEDSIWIELEDGTRLEYSPPPHPSLYGDLYSRKPKGENGLTHHHAWHAKEKMEVGVQLLNSIDKEGSHYSIPLWAVNAGKPAVVAYLWVIEGLNKDEIAREMSLTRGSVSEYIRRVRES